MVGGSSLNGNWANSVREDGALLGDGDGRGQN